MYVVEVTKYGYIKEETLQLKIIVPEDLNYENLFDDIFDEYTKSCKVERIRTRDFGALYELSYSIVIKDGISNKEFIDKLRCRNGNINITLTSNKVVNNSFI